MRRRRRWHRLSTVLIVARRAGAGRRGGDAAVAGAGHGAADLAAPARAAQGPRAGSSTAARRRWRRARCRGVTDSDRRIAFLARSLQERTAPRRRDRARCGSRGSARTSSSSRAPTPPTCARARARSTTRRCPARRARPRSPATGRPTSRRSGTSTSCTRRPDHGRDALRDVHLPRPAHADRRAADGQGPARASGYDRLVLSACHPLFSAAQRIVVVARLTSVTPLGAAVAGQGSEVGREPPQPHRRMTRWTSHQGVERRQREMYLKELKQRVEHDSYVVDPHLVAEALLRRAAARRADAPVITRRGARDRAASPRPRRPQG